jgi:hydrogenase maturation protease
MKKAVVVLGLGNPLMADEGIGVAVVQRLAEAAARYPSVDFLDAGTGGMSLLHLLEGRRKAVVIDCALMDDEPGAIKRFTCDQVRSRKVLAHQSLHEADLMHIIAMARQLGQAPEEIVIFGIQPQTVEPGEGLSPVLRDRIEQYVTRVLQELGEFRREGG